jgi:hypothetical protein
MKVDERDAARPADEGCGGRALCGWSPPSLAADTGLKRRVDLIRLGNAATIGVLVVVIGLLNLAAHLSVRPELVVYSVTGLAAGGWCLLNFWRCRHAHCLMTGPGWLAFGVFALIEAFIGRSLIGEHEEAAFLAILCIAVLFEMAWYARYRTKAVSFHRTA